MTISHRDLGKTEALEIFLYICYSFTEAFLESSPQPALLQSCTAWMVPPSTKLTGFTHSDSSFPAEL